MHYNYSDLDFLNKELAGIWPGWTAVKLLGKGSFGAVYEIHRTIRRNSIDISTSATPATQTAPQQLEVTEKAALKVLRVPESDMEIDQIELQGMSRANTDKFYEKQVAGIRNEIKIMQKFVGNSHLVSYEDYVIRKRPENIGWDIYIRMELLTALPEYMEQHPLDEETTLRLALDTAKGLCDCHQRGVIHRDIKPQNIFVTEEERFKLGDFGVSRAIPGTQSVLSFKGTLSYMAPEVFRMASTDARSDIYSLGIVLYQCLNDNRLPFVPEAITPESIETAKLQRLSGQPVPAPAHGSPALQSIVLQSLAFRPEDRFQTAKAMYNALLAVSRGEVDLSDYLFVPKTSSTASTSPAAQAADSTGFGGIGATFGRGAAGAATGTGTTSATSKTGAAGAATGTGAAGAATGSGATGATPNKTATLETESSSATPAKSRGPKLPVPVIAVACVVLVIIAGIFGATRLARQMNNGTSLFASAGATGAGAETAAAGTTANAAGANQDSNAANAAGANQNPNAANAAGTDQDTNANDSTDPASIQSTGELEDFRIEWNDEILEGKMHEITGIFDRDLYYSDVKDITELDFRDDEGGTTLVLGPIKNISALACMKKLRFLYIEHGEITDISCVRGMKNLKDLNLRYNKIEDLSPLEDLTQLQFLYLSGNNISDVSPLAKLKNLKQLCIEDCNVSDISSLSNLHNLEKLYLSGNNISDISAVEFLYKMKEFTIFRNKVSDISCLSHMTNLEVLDAWDNNISDISVVANFTNKLFYLDLGMNEISDISVLANFSRLSTLMLNDNNITDISALGEMDSVGHLDLENNPIEDYSPLNNLSVNKLVK